MKKRSKMGRKIITNGLETRAQILEAFLLVSYQIGPENITLQRLAKASQVTLGTVRYYFADKDQKLYEAALLHLLEKAYQAIESFINERRQHKDFNPLASYIDAMFLWIENSPVDSSFLVYFYYLCTTQVKLPIPNQALLERARTRIRGLIHEGLGQGLYVVQDPVDEIVLKIHAVVTGTCIVAATQGDITIKALQKNICRQMVLKQLLMCKINF